MLLFTEVWPDIHAFVIKQQLRGKKVFVFEFAQPSLAKIKSFGNVVMQFDSSIHPLSLRIILSKAMISNPIYVLKNPSTIICC